MTVYLGELIHFIEVETKIITLYYNLSFAFGELETSYLRHHRDSTRNFFYNAKNRENNQNWLLFKRR